MAWGRCGNAVGIGRDEGAGRNGRDGFQIGPEAPGLGKAPNDRSPVCYASTNP